MSPEGTADEQPPFLRIVKGDASAEEIAALVSVIHAGAAAAVSATAKPRSEWSAHHRRMRPVFPSGPAGWRSSSLPR